MLYGYINANKSYLMNIDPQESMPPPNSKSWKIYCVLPAVCA